MTPSAPGGPLRRATRPLQPARPRPAWLQWAAFVLATLSQVYLVLVLTLVAISLVPQALGWHGTVVTSGSMEPHITAGDVVLLADLADDDPMPVGGVVQFDTPATGARESGSRLHRIIGDNEDGTYVTAGDANAEVDTTPLTRDLVTGQGRILVQHVGLPGLWLSQGEHLRLALWAGLTMLAIALAASGMRRWDDEPDADATARERPGSRAPAAVPTTALVVILGLGLSLGGAVPVSQSSAAFTGTTANHGSTWAAAKQFVTSLFNYRGVIAADEPWAYFPLDDAGSASIAADASGNARDARYSTLGASRGVTGALPNQTNRAIALNGTAAATFSTPARPVAAPTTFTVELWLRTSPFLGGELVSFGNQATGTSTAYDRALYMGTDGRLSFSVSGSPGARRAVTSPRSYSDNAWHHVAATVGPAGTALYVDGALVASDANRSAQAMTGFWRVGGDTVAGLPNRPVNTHFVGSIDEVAIYETQALSAARVRAHAQTARESAPGSYISQVLADSPSSYYRFEETGYGMIPDVSGHGRTATYPARGVTYGVEGALPKMNNRAVALSGFLSSVSVQTLHRDPQAFTLEAWVSTETRRGGQIIGFGSTTSPLAFRADRRLYLADNGQIVFAVNPGTTRSLTSPGTYTDGRWHHVVATMSSAGSTLYVDGLPVASDATMNRAGSFDGYWLIGAGYFTGWPSQPSSTYLDATLDEVAVYDRALTPAQVAAHHAAR